MGFDQHTELQLMEALEAEPETSQADLAAKAGVAVGTVNWYMKRWSSKGFVKVKRIGRWRWRYLLTSQGMSEKTRLAGKYFEASMRIYRLARNEARDQLGQVRDCGYETVVIEGEGDLVDICRLTCLELGIRSTHEKEINVPVMVVNGMHIETTLPDSNIKTDDDD